MKKTKIYSELELKDKAKAAFERFRNADSLFATTDGNLFLSRNRAELHAGAKGRVITIDRPLPEPEAPKTPKMNAKEAIAQIADASLEALAAFADDERKTVQEAYQNRLEELGITDNKEEDE